MCAFFNLIKASMRLKHLVYHVQRVMVIFVISKMSPVWHRPAGVLHLVVCFTLKDKEEVLSPGGESDSNSTTTTPKTVISNQSSLPHHSPTPSLGSEASLGGSDRDRPATPKPSTRLARSVTPVSNSVNLPDNSTI